MDYFKYLRKGFLENYQKHRNKKLPPFWCEIDFLWRKKYIWLILYLAILGALIINIFLKVTLNDYLVYFTFWVVFWYSRETMDLKQISNKQTEHLRIEHKTNLRPYLRLQKGGERGLILVNEGKGVAVNLRPIYKNDGGVTREFLQIPAMAAAPGSWTESFVPIGFDLGLNPSIGNFTVEINYNDIEERNYYVVFKSNPLFNDGFEIIRQEEI